MTPEEQAAARFLQNTKAAEAPAESAAEALPEAMAEPPSAIERGVPFALTIAIIANGFLPDDTLPDPGWLALWGACAVLAVLELGLMAWYGRTANLSGVKTRAEHPGVFWFTAVFGVLFVLFFGFLFVGGCLVYLVEGHLPK